MAEAYCLEGKGCLRTHSQEPYILAFAHLAYSWFEKSDGLGDEHSDTEKLSSFIEDITFSCSDESVCSLASA